VEESDPWPEQGGAPLPYKSFVTLNGRRHCFSLSDLLIFLGANQPVINMRSGTKHKLAEQVVFGINKQYVFVIHKQNVFVILSFVHSLYF
jgi:hypothetical protein